MRKTIVAATLLAALGAAFVPSATAGDSFDTEVVIIDGNTFEDDFLIHGVLKSDRQRCVSKRKVSMQIDPGGGYVTRDVTKSSDNGAFAVYADDNDATGIRVKVSGKQLRNGDVCRGQTENVPF